MQTCSFPLSPHVPLLLWLCFSDRTEASYIAARPDLPSSPQLQSHLRGFLSAGAFRGRVVMPKDLLRGGSAVAGSVDDTVDDSVAEGGTQGAAWALRTGLAALDGAAAAGAAVDGPAVAGGRPIDFHADIESLASVAKEFSDGCSLAMIDGSAEREV
jgi:hypothetical protein